VKAPTSRRATIVAPLYEIVKIDIVLKWSQEQAKAFQALKEILTKTPILTVLNFTKSFEIECDASNIGIGADSQKKKRRQKCVLVSNTYV